EAHQTICDVGKGDPPPIGVRVRWKAFTKGSDAYVAWYAMELEKSAPGVTVKLKDAPTLHNTNADKGGPFMTAVGISVSCTSKVSKTVVEDMGMVYVRADGVSTTNPPW